MDPKIIIAKRVAKEMKPGSLVNLGIGLPTMVAQFLPPGFDIYFESENGLIGMSSLPPGQAPNPAITDAGGGFIGMYPGAAVFDSAWSFGLIRGGHIDTTVLGGLQVDEEGHLANWIVPGKVVPGMGGAMDLVTGAKTVIVSMTHSAKGEAKILKKCTLPLTSVRKVNMIVTDLAVIDVVEDGLVLREVAPGVTVEQVLAQTEATLKVPDRVPEMDIAA